MQIGWFTDSGVSGTSEKRKDNRPSNFNGLCRNARNWIHQNGLHFSRASQCSIGVFLDDPPNISALKELFIDFINGASRETIAGAKKKSDAD
ncbi:hypothetical protein OS493_024031 [Desmophyllum pertusum]|uniref:Uncharacterized protein n=1 Tax=Desmophyllum pertusum TaxID=174260 RepID=A0A9W9ZN64_9CNID|nr:hypothetical protein OS493_024031 [Desmophyllum pertusum]